MKKILLITLAFLLSSALFGATDKKVDFRLNLKQGEVYRLSTNTRSNSNADVFGIEFSIAVTYFVEFEYRVVQHKGDEYTLETVYRSIESQTTVGQQVQGQTYDRTKRGRDGWELEESYLELIGKPFMVIITDKGEVKRIDGLEQIMSGFIKYLKNKLEGGHSSRAGVRGKLDYRIEDLGEKMIKNIITFPTSMLPDAPVAIGESWSRTINSDAWVVLRGEGECRYLEELDEGRSIEGEYRANLEDDKISDALEKIISHLSPENVKIKVMMNDGLIKTKALFNKESGWVERLSGKTLIDGVMSLTVDREKMEIPVNVTIEVEVEGSRVGGKTSK